MLLLTELFLKIPPVKTQRLIILHPLLQKRKRDFQDLRLNKGKLISRLVHQHGSPGRKRLIMTVSRVCMILLSCIDINLLQKLLKLIPLFQHIKTMLGRIRQ